MAPGCIVRNRVSSYGIRCPAVTLTVSVIFEEADGASRSWRIVIVVSNTGRPSPGERSISNTGTVAWSDAAKRTNGIMDFIVTAMMIDSFSCVAIAKPSKQSYFRRRFRDATLAFRA